MTPEEKEVVWRVLRNGEVLNLADRRNCYEYCQAYVTREEARLHWKEMTEKEEARLNALLDSL